MKGNLISNSYAWWNDSTHYQCYSDKRTCFHRIAGNHILPCITLNSRKELRLRNKWLLTNANHSVWIISKGKRSFESLDVRNQVALTGRFHIFCISMMNSRSSSLTLHALCTNTARSFSGYIFLICIAVGNPLLPWRLHLLFHHFQESVAASWLHLTDGLPAKSYSTYIIIKLSDCIEFHDRSKQKNPDICVENI